MSKPTHSRPNAESGLAADSSQVSLVEETVSFRDEPPSTVNLREATGVPRRFGEYELLGEIARGGMGVVYRARQVLLNRVVALKMILAGQLADDEAVRRFQTEAEAAAKLDHPGIVPIHEIGQIDGQHFFSMGFVEGESLAVRLRGGPLGNRAAAELLHGIAEAVEYAHQRGIIHRDLKPGNVLLKQSRESRVEGREQERFHSGSQVSTLGFQPVVTDFGLAKIVQSDSELTSTGQVMGTPAYMPPEQAAGRIDQIGPQSDVYSLGAVLYCTLTGRPPFHAASLVETLQQVLHHEPVPLRQLNPDIDRDLETICLKCLEKQPPQRFASAAALADELGRWLRGEPIQSRRATSVERAGKWVRRRPAVAAFVAMSLVATLLLAGLSVGLYYQSQLQAEKVEANSQRDAAQTARKHAESARNELEVQKQQVEVQRDLIEQQKTEVERQKSLVEVERDRTRRIQYSSDVNMADRAWQEDQVGEMYRILTRNVPQTGEQDLRGWEWYYLWQQGSWSSAYFHGTHGARQMAYAPQGHRVAVCGSGPFVDVWDLNKTRLRITITAELLPEQSLTPNDSVDSVAITPDGKTLVMGFHNGRLVAWDCEADKMIIGTQSGIGPRGYLVAVDVTADGQLFVGGDSAGGIRVWDRSGKLVHDLKVKSDSTGAVRFSPDGRRIAATLSDHSVLVFDAASGEQQLTLLGHTSYAMCLDWSPDGSLIAGGAFNEETRLWDAVTGEVRHVLRGHHGTVNSVAFRPDGLQLATCGADGTIRLWDVATGSLRRVLRGHSQYVYSVDWLADGSQILTSSADGSTRIWPLAVTPEARVLDATTPLVNASVAFSRDGSLLAVVRRDGGIVVRNSVTGQITRDYGTGQGYHIVVEFHPDGKRLAVSAADGTVKLWNLATGDATELTRHLASVQDIAFSPDGSRLATASDDQTARIIDIESGRVLHTLTQHTNMVWAVAWSPDNKWVATGGHDGQLMLWNPDTGVRVRHWPILNFPRGMTFSPDSRQIATQGMPQGVDLHSVETGEVTLRLRGHADGIGGIAFSPDGRRIFTSSWDRTVKVFDAATGQSTLTLPSLDKVNAIALHPNGQLLAGIGDHTTTTWYAPVPMPSPHK